MIAVQGYFKNKTFITDSNISIPDGQPAIVTVLDAPAVNEAEDAQRQKKIFREFYAAIQADSEKLTGEFDKVLAEGLHFRDIDLS
jgi:hypothetical protein